MPSDALRIEDTWARLVKASKDLERGKVSLPLERPNTQDAVFHCQQAVEKELLKAFLVWRDPPFRKMQDLVELAARCTGVEPELVVPLHGVGGLTPYAP